MIERKSEIREMLFRLDLLRKKLLQPFFLSLGLSIGQGQPRILNHLLIKDDITQKELAEMIGVHQKDISRWENGERTPNIEAFSGICKALKTSADTLLELEIGKD